jgi:hypothetical protein
MTSNKELRKQAIKAAYPFGGFAMTEHKPLLDELEAEGLIEINCREDDGYGYNLTPGGKKAVFNR